MIKSYLTELLPEKLMAGGCGNNLSFGLFRNTPPLAAGTKPWGCQRGEVLLTPLVVSEVLYLVDDLTFVIRQQMMTIEFPVKPFVSHSMVAPEISK